MPKSAQKRASNSGKPDSRAPTNNDNDYESSLIQDKHMAEDEDEFPPYPVTPSKPPLAKKPTFTKIQTGNMSNPDEIITTLANLINTRSDALESMVQTACGEIKELKSKMLHMEKRIDRGEQTTRLCMDRVTDLERYGRRWNLRLHGLPETTKENVREEVIRVCQEVLPQEAAKLPEVIDVAQRLGTRLTNETRPRATIIRFTARRFRDAVWKAAKSSEFLRNQGMQFKEDLTKEDRDSRQKLWPLIKKARDDGKSAYFVGGRGFIEGTEVTG